jgi:hypothetical protein
MSNCSGCGVKITFKIKTGQIVVIKKKKFLVRECSHHCLSNKNRYCLSPEDGGKWVWYGEAWLLNNMESESKCIVCGVDVEIENGLAKRHDHEGKLCYGSLVPQITETS